MMDPDKTLEKIRSLIPAADECPCNYLSCGGLALRELSQLVEALDKWLSTGGYMPVAWHG